MVRVMAPPIARPHALCAALALVACGDPWTPAGDSTVQADAAPSAWLTAAAGGVIRSADGRARLVIPPGALLADGPVTLAARPAESGTMGAVYAVEPADLALSAAISIELELEAPAPFGRRASAALRVEDRWLELPASAAGHAPDRVVGELTRAGVVAAVTWEEAPGATTAWCEAELDVTTECEGSPIGVWRIEAACAPELARFNDPFAGQCPTAAMTTDLRWEGSMEIGEVAMVARLAREETVLSFDAPDSCAGADRCAALTDDKTECASDGDRCRCVQRTARPPHDVALPISIEGDLIVASDGRGAAVARLRFCRRGDRVILESVRDPGVQRPVLRYVLAR